MSARPLIIGVGHKKLQGKDTFVDACLAELGARATSISFAGILKYHVALILNVEIQEINDNKEAFRPMLQWYGTEYTRKYLGKPTMWIDELAAKIRNLDDQVDVVFIPDVRCRNEVDYVKRNGGILIKIHRPNMPDSDTHVTENELNDYAEWDFIFRNYGIKMLQEQAKIFASRVIPTMLVS